MTQLHTPSSLPCIRLMMIKDGEQAYRPVIGESRHVIEHAKELEAWDREEFRIYLLNTKHRLLGVHTVSIGNLSSSLVHPREVYKAAVLANAHAIIGVHNHPSGDPTPSPEDYALTTRLVQAGEILGIAFLDHIIIGHQRHLSFADSGLLTTLAAQTCLT